MFSNKSKQQIPIHETIFVHVLPAVYFYYFIFFDFFVIFLSFLFFVFFLCNRRCRLCRPLQPLLSLFSYRWTIVLFSLSLFNVNYANAMCTVCAYIKSVYTSRNAAFFVSFLLLHRFFFVHFHFEVVIRLRAICEFLSIWFFHGFLLFFAFWCICFLYLFAVCRQRWLDFCVKIMTKLALILRKIDQRTNQHIVFGFDDYFSCINRHQLVLNVLHPDIRNEIYNIWNNSMLSVWKTIELEHIVTFCFKFAFCYIEHSTQSIS